jgi:RHS repeat-associated protein
MAGISDKAAKVPYTENKYRYNGGNELQNKEFSDGSGLEMYDANFRGYDPQLGRFWQIDPLADVNEAYSPYSFANDNPILLNDPLGLADDTSWKTLPSVTVTPSTPPPSPVTVGVANTNGGDPDVAGAAGPAAPLVAAPIQSDQEKQGFAKLNDRLGYNPYDFQYQQDHYVVREPTFFQNLFNDSDNGILLGYNWKNNPVYLPFYGGIVAPQVTSVGGPGGAAVTIFENISTTTRSITNFFVGIKAAQSEATLAKLSGKAWQLSGDGKAKILLYDGLKYVSRLSTKGEATVDIYRGDQLLQKYRLLH